MKRKITFTFCLIVLITTRAFTQEIWVPFLQQTKTAPSITLSSSTNSNVSFSVQINGISVSQKFVNDTSYQIITIPCGQVMGIQGSPEVPMITKLIAIPDCDNVTISISPSNQLEFSNYNVIPSPRLDPDNSNAEVYEVNNSVYSTNALYPGKNGEIVETGYVRSQKVATVAIYPVQFNPVSKTISVFTNFNITLSFVNPKSTVNKELGIFQNMMHHTALNYAPDSLSASTKITWTSQSNVLSKASLKRATASTSGSATWVTNLSTLTSGSTPCDYLIITHSSLFTSAACSTLANYRGSHNGFDVAVVQVSDIYTYESDNTFQGIRNFIASVYNNGLANHTGDGHLAYLLLLGDAYLDNNTTVMVPAAYPTYQKQDYNPAYDSAGDYYYSCLTQSGGNYDDDQDIMYGRISVGDTSKLRNVVNKIINYEANTNGNWNENYLFVSDAPEYFSGYSDPAIVSMTNFIPASFKKGYGYRSISPSITNVTEANPILGLTYADSMYNDGLDLCGSHILNHWLYTNTFPGLNSNTIHTFVYEGHGGWNGLGANEGCGRYIFYLNGANCLDPGNDSSVNSLLNNTFNTFMIFNCCDAGHFDNGTAWPADSGNCLAEYVVYSPNVGAIGCLASSRTSYATSFGNVDQYIIDAQYNGLSYIMGEAVMESKLELSADEGGYGLLFRRQYNLYGDPAQNLWPTNNNITHNSTLSGINNILTNITVAPGITLTVSPGATINFSAGATLTINGTLSAQGTSTSPITFNFSSPTTNNGIIFNSGSSGTVSYCRILNAYNGINENSASINVSNSSISQCSIGLSLYNSNPTIKSCSIDTNSVYGIYLISSSPRLDSNYILKNGYGIFCSTSSNPTFGNGTTTGGNNIAGNTCGVFCENNSIPMIGNNSPLTGGYNNLENTQYNVYNMSSNGVYAENNYWNTTNPSLFLIAGESSVAYSPYLSSSANIANPPLSKAAANLYTSQSSASLLFSQLNQANQMIASNNLAGAKTICLNMINNYPDSCFSYNALNLLKGLYPAIDSVKNIYQSLFNNSQKKDIYAMAGLILADVDAANKLSHINDVINSYGQDNVVQCALFDKFVYYHFEKGDKQNALVVLKNLDNLFPLSQADIEAHISLGDTVYYKIDLSKKPAIQEASVQLPTEYKLFDNYPNPFNPSTVIQYQIPTNGMVTLKVFDILGREISTLVHECKTIGSYSVSFDASKLASGVYIYQLNAGNYVSTKKMMYLK